MCIYKITNIINSKVYIGQTINFKKRIYHHKYSAKNEDSKSHFPIYRAMNKYGIDNFKFEIIDTSNNKVCLNKKEEFYIDMYNSCNPDFGYNVQSGGVNIFSERLSKILKKSKSNGTPMDMRVINITDNIIYRSGHECARVEYSNMKSKNCPIHKVCDPKSNYFKYKNKEYRYLDENGNIIEKIRNKNRHSFYYICKETNEKFLKQVDILNKYKISKPYFVNCINNKGGYVNKINMSFERVSM